MGDETRMTQSDSGTTLQESSEQVQSKRPDVKTHDSERLGSENRHGEATMFKHFGVTLV